MGKEKKDVKGRDVSAVSEGFTKPMPPSAATGVVFVGRSHCDSMETT